MRGWCAKSAEKVRQVRRISLHFFIVSLQISKVCECGKCLKIRENPDFSGFSYMVRVTRLEAHTSPYFTDFFGLGAPLVRDECEYVKFLVRRKCD